MELSNKILSDITVYTKYAKYLPNKQRRETWEDLVSRNKEMHIKSYPNLKNEIEDVYKFVYDKKVLPSMRSMQFGGKPIEISPNRIYNCAYLPIDHLDAFSETMFLLLGGTGVGYSVFELIRTFEKISNKKIPYQIVKRRPGDLAINYADPTYAKEKLGWKAEKNLEQMCIDTWNFQRNFSD